MRNVAARYNITLYPLTDIYIGSGEDIEVYEYTVKNGYLYKFDMYSIYDKMSSEEQKNFINTIKKENFVHIRSWIYKNYDEKWGYIYKEKVSEDFKKLYCEKVTGKVKQNEGNQLKIAKFIEEQSGKYIPGSSIKGALRTAYIYEEILKLYKNQRLEKIYEEYNSTIKNIEYEEFTEITENFIKRVTENDKELKKYENIFRVLLLLFKENEYLKEIEKLKKEKETKLEEIQNEKDFKNRKLKIEEIKNKFTEKEKEIKKKILNLNLKKSKKLFEAEILKARKKDGKLGLEPKKDPFRMLKITDSNTIDLENFKVVIEKANLKQNESSNDTINIALEILNGKMSILFNREYELVKDDKFIEIINDKTVLFSMVLSNYLFKPEDKAKNKIEKNINKNNLFRSLRRKYVQFISKIIEEIKDDDLKKFYLKLQKIQEKIEKFENIYLIRLGKYTKYNDKTINFLTNNPLIKLGETKDSNSCPMGWALIKVEEVKDE